MKTACSILYLICSSVMMAQSVHLSVPAVDASNNAVTIGMAYFTWGQFTGNDGIAVQAGQLTRPVTNGTIDVTLPASDNAGYVYTLLFMHGSTADTFKWRVPGAGASTMAELNQPPATNNDSTTVHTDEANIYTAGKKQTFSASGTTAGEAFAGVSTDPSAAVAGDRWFRTDLHHIRIHDGATARSVMYQSDALPANQLTNPTAATSLLFAANPFNVTFGNSTGSGNMMNILDTTGNTGTGYVFTAGTASGSSAKPFQVLGGGVQIFGLDAAGSMTVPQGTTNPTQRFTSSGGLVQNWLQRYDTDASNAPFGMVLERQNDPLTPGRTDNVLSFGYNRGLGTPCYRANTNEYAFYQNWESHWTTAEPKPQHEFYFEYCSADGTVMYRPFAITPHLDDNTTTVGIYSNLFQIGYNDSASQNWLWATSTPTSGELKFLKNSHVDFDSSVTSTDIFNMKGRQAISFGTSATQLALGGGFTETNFGRYVDLGSNDLTLSVGTANANGPRGLRWNHTAHQWEFQDNTTAWKAMATTPRLDQVLDPTAAKTFSMGSNALALTYGATTSTANMLAVQDTTGNTGTGYVFTAGTASGSSAKPFGVSAGGTNVIDVDSTAKVTLGTSGTDVFVRRAIFAANNVAAGNAFWFNTQNLLMQANPAIGDSGNAYQFADTSGGTNRQIQTSSLWIGAIRNGTRLGGFDPNGSATVAGLQTAVSKKTANYTATSNDTSLPCDASAGNVVITLPAAPKTGEWKGFKKVDSTSNTCTYSGNGKNIEGAATLVYSTQYQHGMAQYDGTQWWLY